MQTGLLIDGQWQDAANGERFDVLDPATGDVITSVAAGGPSDAVAAGRCCSSGPTAMGRCRSP